MLAMAGYSCVEVEKQNVDSLRWSFRNAHWNFRFLFTHSHTKEYLQLKWGWFHNFCKIGVACLTQDSKVQGACITLGNLLLCKPDIFLQGKVRCQRLVQNSQSIISALPRSQEGWRRADCPSCADVVMGGPSPPSTPRLPCFWTEKDKGEVLKNGCRWR